MQERYGKFYTFMTVSSVSSDRIVKGIIDDIINMAVKTTEVDEQKTKYLQHFIIPVNPPPFRGSLLRKSLISRMDWVSYAGDINLPHTPFPPAGYPPNKKIKYNKILTYILQSIFLEIPHLELPR